MDTSTIHRGDVVEYDGRANGRQIGKITRRENVKVTTGTVPYFEIEGAGLLVPAEDVVGVLRYVPRVEEKDDDYPTVWTDVEGVDLDRPTLQGYAVKDRKMADRLCAAIRAGVVFHSPRILTDVNGKTYLGVSSNVLGRMMNADLRRLGF